MKRLAILIAVLPTFAFAAGGDSSSAPSAPSCKNGQVYDQQTRKCVNKSSQLLDDSERYAAVRSYAYDGQLDVAASVLDSMSNQNADEVLTYRGFIARQKGDMATAMRAYHTALRTNPDNILARSYLAQGLVSLGDLDGAQAQHDEIIARGGLGTWAEVSLARAIETGETYRY